MENYGNLYHVMTEYKKEVKAWLIIRTQSAKWNQVDTSDVICMLQAKLTGHARDKWARHMLSIRGRQMREPDQVDF